MTDDPIHRIDRIDRIADGALRLPLRGERFAPPATELTNLRNRLASALTVGGR